MHHVLGQMCVISSAVSFHQVLAITKWNAEGLYLFQGPLVPQCLARLYLFNDPWLPKRASHSRAGHL